MINSRKGERKMDKFGGRKFIGTMIVFGVSSLLVYGKVIQPSNWEGVTKIILGLFVGGNVVEHIPQIVEKLGLKKV